MGTSERRMEIMKYLCRKRHATMPELAVEFDVSIRTIQRDIFELGFMMPLDVRAGRHDGGVYVVGNYSMDRMYMNEDELQVLEKIALWIDKTKSPMLDDEEKKLLKNLISNYTKPSRKGV